MTEKNEDEVPEAAMCALDTAEDQNIADLKATVEKLMARIDVLENGDPQLVDPPDSGVADGLKALAKQLHDQAENAGIFRRSRREGTIVEQNHTKENFDVMAEATKAAEAHGHRIGKWGPVPPGQNEIPTPDHYHALCVGCGGVVTARWRHDKRLKYSFPSLGGELLLKDCTEVRAAGQFKQMTNAVE